MDSVRFRQYIAPRKKRALGYTLVESVLETRMPQAIDFSSIPDKEREAFYGLMFAIAAADGSFDGEEMTLIHSMLDVSGLSDESCDRIRTFRVTPPDLTVCLKVLSKCRDELRHGTMMSLVDIALADGVLTESEERALDEAAEALDIRDDQLLAMLELVDEAAGILNRDTSKDLDNSQLRQKARNLSASGITHSAAFFSGTIIRLISVARDAVANALNIGL
ncbi:MAG: putative tellurite resistance protein B-like protein, partial [Planctomycetota bacterium]